MERLSERLQVMADKILDSKTVADIGSDHGFLPIYLIEKKKCQRVIVSDISGPSLEKAEGNCTEALTNGIGSLSLEDFSQRLDFRLGDGLKVLKRGEVDTVIIAGMGGRLIRDIMALDFRHTCSFAKYVLQPRTGQGYLRKWLCENGFGIVGEDVVKEGVYLPEIITVYSPKFIPRLNILNNKIDLSIYEGNDIICKVPQWMKEACGPVGDLVNMNIRREREILNNLGLSKMRDYKGEERIKANIEYLRKLYKEINNG